MISIIIVNFNGRDHLAHGLAELVRQGATETEVVLVDNGSTDGSLSMVAEQFPDTIVVPLGENLGFGAANNRGVSRARGDTLLLLNSDAWPAPGALPSLQAALDRDPRLGLVAPQLRYPDGRLQFGWVPESGVVGEALQMARNPFETHRWNHTIVPPLLRAVTGPGWFSGACVMVQRAAFEAIGGFDEQIFLYFEDVDLCRRLRRAGWRLQAVPEATVLHVKGGSVDATTFNLRYREGQLAYYAKHRPPWEQRFLRWNLQRKFHRLEDTDQRRRLLSLLTPDPQAKKW